jgi:hypothetical protein
MNQGLPSTNLQPGTDLLRCEGRIQKGMEDVHGGLLEIHENNYWKDTHERFEDYCRDRMGLSKSAAYRMLTHGKVMRNIAEHMTPDHGAVPNEAQAAELDKLPEAKQAEVWQSVGGSNEAPTVEKVQREVEKRKEPAAPVLDRSKEKIDKQISALEKVAQVASEIAHGRTLPRQGVLMEALHAAKVELTKLKGLL